MSWRRLVVLGFAGAWAVTVLLVFAQAYFMGRVAWAIPVGVLVALAIGATGWYWSRATQRGSRLARGVLGVLGALHVLPLVLQVATVVSPRVDNLLLGVLGWLMLAAALGTGTPSAATTNR